MIIENYSTFREAANPGGSVDADGLPIFDPANMRANSFDGGITVSSTSSFPIVLECVPTAANPYIKPTDLFDWYVSQRTLVADDKPFVVTRGVSDVNDKIVLDLAAWSATEYPDPFDLSVVKVLFFAIDIYCIRRADQATQRLDLKRYLVDALTPKTGIG